MRAIGMQLVDTVLLLHGVVGATGKHNVRQAAMYHFTAVQACSLIKKNKLCSCVHGVRCVS